MRLLLLVAALTGGAAAFHADDCRAHGGTWACDYMEVHNKTYRSMGEFRRRTKVLEHAKERVDMLTDTTTHRRRLEGVNFALGPYADRYTHETHHNVHLDDDRHKERPRRQLRLASGASPATVDWRLEGFKSPVRVQGDCGGCFAFAATTVLEYWDTKWRRGAPRSISAQAAMDCTSGPGGLNDGCEGGLMEDVFEYAELHHLPYTEEDPYTGEESTCRTGSVPDLVGSYGVITGDEDPRAEDHIAWLVANYGPVAVGIDSRSDAFQNYAGGIFRASMCDNDIDHAVAIVGYAPDYWIVKNSWGSTWGEDGYMRLERGTIACGISEYITYVRTVHE